MNAEHLKFYVASLATLPFEQSFGGDICAAARMFSMAYFSSVFEGRGVVQAIIMTTSYELSTFERPA